MVVWTSKNENWTKENRAENKQFTVISFNKKEWNNAVDVMFTLL